MDKGKDVVGEAIMAINGLVPDGICIRRDGAHHIGIYNANRYAVQRDSPAYSRFARWCVYSLLNMPEMILRSAERCASLSKPVIVSG